MGKYDKLLDQHKQNVSVQDEQFAVALHGMQEMVEDADKIAALYHNADTALEEIDRQFQEATNELITS